MLDRFLMSISDYGWASNGAKAPSPANIYKYINSSEQSPVINGLLGMAWQIYPKFTTCDPDPRPPLACKAERAMGHFNQRRM